MARARKFVTMKMKRRAELRATKKGKKDGDVESQIADTKPDYARVSFDVNSNQIVTEGDVAWVKRVQGGIRNYISVLC